MKATSALAGSILATSALFAGVAATAPVSTAGESYTNAATSAVKAKAKAKGKAKSKGKSNKTNFKNCKDTRRFNERRFNYTRNAKRAGRCAASEYKRVKLISSYNGHHPSAEKALDIMTNLSGSCRQNRETGDQVAKYMMKNAKKLGVRYIIWENRYWAAGSGQKKLGNWRNMNRGGCTAGHYDHVHVAFK